MDEADHQAKRRIEVPLLVTWGARSHTGTVHGDVPLVWRDYAINASSEPTGCGHYMPEDAPDAIYKAFMRYFWF
jgi:haloacetate dehalogenase